MMIRHNCERNEPDSNASTVHTQFLLQTPTQFTPIIIPNFTITVERAREVMDQMQPLSAQPVVTNQPYKHLPVDRHFIELIEDLKPTQTLCEKPGHPLSIEEQRKYNASRMREYRRKSNETLEKSKKMLEGLQTQCTVNAVRLKNMLNDKTVEDRVRKHAAEFLQIPEENLMLIPDVLMMFQQYWRRRKSASESNFELKSMIYLERVIKLEMDHKNHKATHGSRSCQLAKKIKDATMKAQSYEYFMDDKRVRKVIGELTSVDNRLKENMGKWLVQSVQANNAEKVSLLF